MIVKNEAVNIIRCLASVRPLVDCAVIVDTGSTDITRELIHAFCDQENLPLEMYDFRFTTWDATRNEALDRALDNGFDSQFDYLLFVDADMEAFGTLDDEALTAPAYSVRQRHGELEWRNFRLVRRDANPRYVGVTHEYTSVEGRIENLDTLWFYDHCDGGNRPGKFARDIALLEEGLLKEPNNARYWYYLGQSYRDARNDKLAIDAFTRRIEIGGWDEETFYAHLERARAAKRL
jgi:glycosyltransferase involved in cell wall biosynthesis